MSEYEVPAHEAPVKDTPPAESPLEPQQAAEPQQVAEGPVVDAAPEPQAETLPAPVRAVDPARSAAGRRGGQRVNRLVELGREYEREKGLTPGRQRLRQLIQLGKRYELEHGLHAAKPRRRPKGDAWAEFVAALARVVKPAHRPAVERLAASLRPDAEGRAAA